MGKLPVSAGSPRAVRVMRLVGRALLISFLCAALAYGIAQPFFRWEHGASVTSLVFAAFSLTLLAGLAMQYRDLWDSLLSFARSFRTAIAGDAPEPPRIARPAVPPELRLRFMQLRLAATIAEHHGAVAAEFGMDIDRVRAEFGRAAASIGAVPSPLPDMSYMWSIDWDESTPST
jgi:hypothetical protein